MLKETNGNILMKFDLVDLSEIFFFLQYKWFFLKKSNNIFKPKIFFENKKLKQFGMVESFNNIFNGQNGLLLLPIAKFWKMCPWNDAKLEIMRVTPFHNDIGRFMYTMVCTKVDIVEVGGLWVNLWLVLCNSIGL